LLDTSYASGYDVGGRSSYSALGVRLQIARY
jgi:hypothetical protein